MGLGHRLVARVVDREVMGLPSRINKILRLFACCMYGFRRRDSLRDGLCAHVQIAEMDDDFVAHVALDHRPWNCTHRAFVCRVWFVEVPRADLAIIWHCPRIALILLCGRLVTAQNQRINGAILVGEWLEHLHLPRLPGPRRRKRHFNRVGAFSRLDVLPRHAVFVVRADIPRAVFDLNPVFYLGHKVFFSLVGLKQIGFLAALSKLPI